MLRKANYRDDLLLVPLTGNMDTKGVLIDNSNPDGDSLFKNIFSSFLKKNSCVAKESLIRNISKINIVINKLIITRLINFIKE